MMRKDHRGPETPVAERDHRTRPRALTRETREAAARWARHRSNEGVLLGKSCHVSELATRQLWNLPADQLLTQGATRSPDGARLTHS